METTTCPFCFAQMTAVEDKWRCEEHGLFHRCPKCGKPITLEKADPPEYWCAAGRVWFDGEMKATRPAAHIEMEEMIYAKMQ